jgi:uracil-DNA glycosylase
MRRPRACPRLRVYLALGAIAWRASLDHFERCGAIVARPRPAFRHGAVVRTRGAPILVGSYHVSQQNTQTGRLTPAMFDEVLGLAQQLANEKRGERPTRPPPGRAT